MNRFLLNIVQFSILILILLIIIFYSTNLGVSRYHFSNSETESNTLVMKENYKYDLAIIGISHARMFSRHRNHERIEKILNKKIINLGQGGSISGIDEQLFYLNYLYEKGNKAESLTFVMSPPLMFSESLPIASNTFLEEKFDLHFLTSYLFADGENKFERITSYLSSKLTKQWLFYQPYSKIAETGFLLDIDSNAVKEGYKLAYGDAPLSYSRFNKSCNSLEKIIQLAQSHQTKVSVIITPALFKKWPGHSSCVDFANKMTIKYNVEFYDFSETVLDPKLYYDHHHLNTKGITHFTTNFLKDIEN